VARFNQDDAVLIRPGDEAPDIGLRRPTLIESEFLKAIAHRLNHDRPLEWRCDTGGRLWVRLWLGGEDWWVSLTPRRMRAPLFHADRAGQRGAGGDCGGIVLHRYTDRLRALVGAVDAYDPDLPRTGPMRPHCRGWAAGDRRRRPCFQPADRAHRRAEPSAR
jgi:two-component system osmolarity sensor histidine kinase EnvZ